MSTAKNTKAKMVKCGRCGEIGHNIKSCKSEFKLPVECTILKHKKKTTIAKHKNRVDYIIKHLGELNGVLEEHVGDTLSHIFGDEYNQEPINTKKLIETFTLFGWRELVIEAQKTLKFAQKLAEVADQKMKQHNDNITTLAQAQRIIEKNVNGEDNICSVCYNPIIMTSHYHALPCHYDHHVCNDCRYNMEVSNIDKDYNGQIYKILHTFFTCPICQKLMVKTEDKPPRLELAISSPILSHFDKIVLGLIPQETPVQTRTTLESSFGLPSYEQEFELLEYVSEQF
jgi:hypothetical protein